MLVGFDNGVLRWHPGMRAVVVETFVMVHGDGHAFPVKTPVPLGGA